MRSTRRPAARHASLMLGLISGSLLAPAWAADDPTDPAAAVPETVYSSVFESKRSDQSDMRPGSKLPWKRLFNDDGSFVPEDQLDGGMTVASPTAKKNMPSDAMQMSDGSDAMGVVKSIDTQSGKIKLKHGPIAKFEMPGMTMKFRVADPELLDTVEEGQQIGFTVEQQGSAFVVTGIQPMAMMSKSDGRAVVKSIDRNAGKVKLKHGPIDKFEMPGMTMKFRVADPSLLDQVKEGEEVGFTVEQQSGAFVITGFQR